MDQYAPLTNKHKSQDSLNTHLQKMNIFSVEQNTFPKEQNVIYRDFSFGNISLVLGIQSRLGGHKKTPVSEIQVDHRINKMKKIEKS